MICTRYQLLKLFPTIVVLAGFAFAQSTFDEGVSKFSNGDYQAAIDLLKKGDRTPSSLYYIGLSYEKLGKQSLAFRHYRDSLIKGEKLVIQLSKEKKYGERIERIVEQNRQHFINAERSFAKYRLLSPKKKLEKRFRNTLYLIKLYPELLKQKKDISKAKSLTPIRIIHMPRMVYTKTAREARFTGKIRLRIVFLRNGRIGFAIPLKKLPFGLTTEAIVAAKKIKFTPARRNGKAYSVIKIVEYSFSYV